ncbi:MAG: hypothetical protein RLZZ383_806 [Pseudomonadota bacterium]|jgi:hypothetical protein
MSRRRFGPAAPLVGIATAQAAIGTLAATVPLGGRTMAWQDASGLFAVAAGLAGWALWTHLQCRRRNRVDPGRTVLVPAMFPGIADLAFTTPLLVTAPTAGLALLDLRDSAPLTFVALLSVVLTLGLLLLREADAVLSISPAGLTLWRGWAVVRKERFRIPKPYDVTVRRLEDGRRPRFRVGLDPDDGWPPTASFYDDASEADRALAVWRAAVVAAAAATPTSTSKPPSTPSPTR